MNSDELLERYRVDVDDLELPYLWSDAEIYSYIDDAQTMFCRRTDGLSDATTPEVTRLVIDTGASYVPLHKSILKLRNATRADDGRPVEILNNEDLAARGYLFNGISGHARFLVIGEEEHKARVYPVPSEPVTLNLLVYRLPVQKITDEGAQELEVSEEHHLHLLHWVKRMAYLKQDADTFDKKASVDFEGRFLAYCAEAKEESRRTWHKSRTVAYGGY